MKFGNRISTHVITPGVILVCLTLTSAPYHADTRFASGKSALAIPFELEGNNVCLQVAVNNSSPRNFVLDTGSGAHIINLATAKPFDLQLQFVGKATGGVGAHPPDLYFVKGKVSFSFPGVALSNQTLFAMALAECDDRPIANGSDRKIAADQKAEKKTRRVIDGILGKEFFESFVVEIDYVARLINLYDPPSYQYTGSGTSFPLEKERGTIFTRVQVKAPGRPPVPARLLVDLPASWAITLNQRFAEKHQLLPPTDKLRVTNECGVAGLAQGVSYEGELQALQLGGFTLSNPLTFFRHTPVGEGYDGLLGGPALRNFKVILDYSRSRMILEPRR